MIEETPQENETIEEEIIETEIGEEMSGEAQPQLIRVTMNESRPVMVYILLGLTVLVYLAQWITKKKFGVDIPLDLGAKFGPLIKIYHQYWRLITPVFIHGGILHLVVNMYSLYSIGPAMESVYGHWGFLFLYLISGFTGNVISLVASPNTVSVGASTALFGLIAAHAVFILKNREVLHGASNALRGVLSVIALNLAIGLSSGIDNWGHLGGLLGGAIMAWGAGPVLGIIPDMETRTLTLGDTLPKQTRVITFALTFVFFALMAIVL